MSCVSVVASFLSSISSAFYDVRDATLRNFTWSLSGENISLWKIIINLLVGKGGSGDYCQLISYVSVDLLVMAESHNGAFEF